MARNLVSVLRCGPAALRSADPVLEANAYAVASDLDLTVLLRGDAVELAVADGEVAPGDLAGTQLPPSAGGQDLQGLVESGLAVWAAAGDVAHRGLGASDLVRGVHLADQAELDELLRTAEAVLTW